MSHKSVSGVCMTGGLRRLTCLDQVRVERMWAHLCDSSIDMSLLSTWHSDRHIRRYWEAVSVFLKSHRGRTPVWLLRVLCWGMWTYRGHQLGQHWWQHKKHVSLGVHGDILTPVDFCGRSTSNPGAAFTNTTTFDRDPRPLNSPVSSARWQVSERLTCHTHIDMTHEGKRTSMSTF